MQNRDTVIFVGAVGICTLIMCAAIIGLTLWSNDAHSAGRRLQRELKVEDYVECVNSRFPMESNGWAYVNESNVVEELARGNLDRAGMAATYASLGCTAENNR